MVKEIHHRVKNYSLLKHDLVLSVDMESVTLM